jgi:hypothetical protein
VNARRTPKLKRLARKLTELVVKSVETRSTIEIVAADITASGEWRLRRLSRPKPRGSCPCCASEYARRPKPEFEVAAAASRTNAPVSPT